jgi:HEPN domain-containing protein
MNRTDFQELAEERLEDARPLLDAGRFSGAYYLAGYAVECALQACIARLTNQEEARYRSYEQQQAAELLSAVADPKHGVMQWLRAHW